MARPAPEVLTDIPPAARDATAALIAAPTVPVKMLVSGGIGTGKSSMLAVVRAALRAAIDRLRSHETEREHREKLAVLGELRLDTDEEKRILSQIGQQKLRQMGIPPK